jgi:D-alanine-D-alanine ligase
MNQKLKVAILCGGKSAEHEVSLQSARNVIAALDPKKYEATIIAIDKQGCWHLSHTDHLLTQMSFSAEENTPGLALIPGHRSRAFLDRSNSHPLQAVDVVFPVLHGPWGEDGSAQGLLKLANVPFVGSDVLGSAVGMDKDVMKRLLRDADIPVAKFLVFRRHEMKDIQYANVAKQLGMPCFVKPANLGSSVGISKARDEKEFLAAIKQAFNYDNKIIIEEAIIGREIECAVLGNDHPRASVLGEIIPHHEFYSYEAKYLDEHGASLEIPAKLPEPVVKAVQALAIKVFKILECAGMARVDFFVTPDERIFVNEVNTIPGFTKISMYPKLWEASGISYVELIDQLIQLALERFAAAVG